MSEASDHRAEWTASRHDRLLARPRPLRVGYINCGAASWPDRPKKVARIMREAAEHCDVVLFSEAFNVDARDVLDDNWAVMHNTSTGAKAGSGVAVRRSRGRIKKRRLILAVTAVLFGRRATQMRDRWIARAVLRIDPGTPHRWTLRVAACHAPPPRNRDPWWHAFMDRVSRVRADVIAADWNALRLAVRRTFDDDWLIRTKGIDGIAVVEWLPATRLEEFDAGSDHPMIALTLFPED